MQIKISLIIFNIIIINILLIGCIKDIGDKENFEIEINDTYKEQIIGEWIRKGDNRTYEYLPDGTLILESMESNYIYWFDNGYLFDKSINKNSPYEYKYNISFVDEETMIQIYLGYYLDGKWNKAISIKYEFNKIK